MWPAVSLKPLIRGGQMEEIRVCTSNTQWWDQGLVPSQHQFLSEDRIAWAVPCGRFKHSPEAPYSTNSGKAAETLLWIWPQQGAGVILSLVSTGSVPHHLSSLSPVTWLAWESWSDRDLFILTECGTHSKVPRWQPGKAWSCTYPGKRDRRENTRTGLIFSAHRL